LINLFRSFDQRSLITETLGPDILPSGRSFQTQLLKVVFTTLYVDVKEPAVSDISSDKKTQLCLPTLNHVSVHHAGTKLSHNLQSQIPKNPLRASLRIGSPVSGGVSKIAVCASPSTDFRKFFEKSAGDMAG